MYAFVKYEVSQQPKILQSIVDTLSQSEVNISLKTKKKKNFLQKMSNFYRIEFRNELDCLSVYFFSAS